MGGLGKRMIKGSLWLTLSRLIANGLSTLSTFILAWFLSPSDFGLVAIATSIMAMLSALTELSLNQALIRHDNPTQSHFSSVWTLNATRGLVLSGLFTASAYPIAGFYEEPRLAGIMLALSLGLLMSGLANPRLVMLQRELNFWVDFLLNVAQKLAGFVVTVSVAVIYGSYWALVLGTLAHQFTTIVISYAVLPFRPRISFRHMRELFSFSIWLSLGQLVNTLNWRVEYLLVGKFLGTAPLGLYTMGNTLASMPTREATTPLMLTVFPGLSKVRDDPARLAAAYQKSQAIVTAVALPAGIGMAMIADPLIRFVLGERWAPAIMIVQGLAAIFAIQTLGSLVQPLGMATNSTRLLFLRDLQMLCLRLPLVVASLFLWGLPGAVYARVLTGLTSTVVNMLLVKRLIGLSLMQQLSANLRALVSAAAMAAGLWALSAFLGEALDRRQLAAALAVEFVAGCAIYTGSTFLMWRLQGRPDGPEGELKTIATAVCSRLRR